MITKLTAWAYGRWASSETLHKLTQPIASIANDFAKTYRSKPNVAAQRYLLAIANRPQIEHEKEFLQKLVDTDKAHVIYVKPLMSTQAAGGNRVAPLRQSKGVYNGKATGIAKKMRGWSSRAKAYKYSRKVRAPHPSSQGRVER